MNEIWDLKGDGYQNTLVQIALRQSSFPWDDLVPGLQAKVGRTQIPVDWADCDALMARGAVAATESDHNHDDHAHTDPTAPQHVYLDGDTGHPVAARGRILGLAWYSGRITLDLSVENNYELMGEVFLSEAAHMIDFFLLTDAQRFEIAKLYHTANPDDPPANHGHGWFDVGSYREWMGEALMGSVTSVYSTFPVTIPFVHSITEDQHEAFRRIVTPYWHTKTGKRYHKSTHWWLRNRTWRGIRPQHLRPCLICRP